MILLTKQNIIDVANKLEIESAILNAIAVSESAGCGFYLDESPYKNNLKCLFEGHYFSKLTLGKFDKSHPTLSYPKWIKGVTTKYYRVGSKEFSRFMEALKLDKIAAQLSTSWGKFQVMGANFKKAGYDSVTEMLIDYYKGEINQFISFLSFCENTYNKELKKNLIELLQLYSKTKDIKYLKGFVQYYNGKANVKDYTAKILKNIKMYK